MSSLDENSHAPRAPTADLLSTTAVAKLLDITSEGVRMLDRRGRLRAFARLDGPHGPRVYDRMTVEKYAAERTARRTPPPPACYSCEHFAQPPVRKRDAPSTPGFCRLRRFYILPSTPSCDGFAWRRP